MLKLIYSDYRICSMSSPLSPLPFLFKPENKIVFPIITILKTFPGKLDFVVKNTSHEEIINNEENHNLAFGFLTPQMEALKRHDLIANFEYTNRIQNDIRFHPTSVGLDLYMRCTGYKVYPLEAYILSRQKWCKSENIDPFWWSPFNE